MVGGCGQSVVMFTRDKVFSDRFFILFISCYSLHTMYIMLNCI